MNESVSQEIIKVTLNDIQEQLSILGKNIEEVAYSLMTKRIKGSRQEFGSCPIVEYLLQNITNIEDLNVTSVISFWLDCRIINNLPFGLRLSIPTPPAIADFISAFDSGAYPELEKPI